MSNSITLTNTEIERLHGGLKALQGIRVGKDEVRYFDFDKDTYWKIVQAQVIVERSCDLHDKARKGLLQKHGLVDGEGVTEENAPRIKAFVEERNDLADQVQKLELPLLDPAKLEEKNKTHRIPHPVMVALWPILLKEGGKDE